MIKSDSTESRLKGIAKLCLYGGHMKKSTGIRFGVGAASLALLLTACGGSGDAASGEGSKGGTLYILTEAEQILHLDPQRN